MGGILFFFLSSCLLAPPKRVPWEGGSSPPDQENPGVLIRLVQKDGFLVYPEPGLDPGDVDRAIQRLIADREELRQQFFPAFRPATTFRVIFYRDLESYRKYRPGEVDSAADYERNRNTLNLPLDASPPVWKHEMVHAMMESIRPGTPFWLNEGLAYFAMFQHFDGPIRCEIPREATIPRHFHLYVPDILEHREMVPGSDFDYRKTSDIEVNSVLSTFFVFYLWKEKRLTKLLHDFENSKEASPEFLLTRGNEREWRVLVSRFRFWLEGLGPYETIPGC